MRGTGVERIVSPRRSGESDLIRAYIENKDDAIGGMFLSTELSDGDYELTILAAGYEPHVSRHRVVAGAAPAFCADCADSEKVSDALAPRNL